jgi:hypothetical protein
MAAGGQHPYFTRTLFSEVLLAEPNLPEKTASGLQDPAVE